MKIETCYVFKNTDKISIVESDHNNTPVAAVDKLKETFMQYGAKTFDAEDIANIFASVNELSSDIIMVDDYNSQIEKSDLVYCIENGLTKKKKQELYITVFKNKSKIFEGEMKTFVEKAKKIEITYMNNYSHA